MSKWIALVLFLGVFCTEITAAPPQTTRKKLDKPTMIQGYLCAKDYAWFYADGKMKSCTVNQETQFGEALLPNGSIVYLKPDGSRDEVQLAHSTRIHDVLCDGGGPLGPAEGSIVGLYPSGKLKLCFLAEDQEVQGVPCAHGGIIATLTGPDPGISFYESGQLRACRLSRDFHGQSKNTIWKQAEK